MALPLWALPPWAFLPGASPGGPWAYLCRQKCEGQDFLQQCPNSPQLGQGRLQGSEPHGRVGATWSVLSWGWLPKGNRELYGPGDGLLGPSSPHGLLRDAQHNRPAGASHPRVSSVGVPAWAAWGRRSAAAEGGAAGLRAELAHGACWWPAGCEPWGGGTGMTAQPLPGGRLPPAQGTEPVQQPQPSRLPPIWGPDTAPMSQPKQPRGHACCPRPEAQSSHREGAEAWPPPP